MHCRKNGIMGLSNKTFIPSEFVTFSHFHPSLIFANKGGAYPMSLSLARKYQTGVEVTNSDELPSLLPQENTLCPELIS